MAEGMRETMEVKQLSHDGHLPMKSTLESVGYELWPSCDVTLKSRTITSVHTGVHVDLPSGYAGIIYNKMGLAHDGIVIVCNILDTSSRGPLNLLVHNTSERDYKVPKENPLAQLIIHRVAKLPAHHTVLHSTFPKENSKVSSPIDMSGEYPNIIPPMPRKVGTLVSPKPYRLHSLEPPKNVPRVLFRDTDASTSDSDGVLFQESPTPSPSEKCSDQSGGLPDFEPDVQLTTTTAATSICRVTHSLTQQGLGNHRETLQDFE